MTNKIEISNLTKIYDTGKMALDHLNLSIDKGQVFGFLGPNGAGKTTTVKLLAGMLEASEGSAKVFGMDPLKDVVSIHQMSGVVTEHAGMYNHLSAIGNLSFYGEVFGLDKKESIKRGEELLYKLGLGDVVNQKLETFSTGMRQRLSFARALIHKPSLLFLDEPTSGLDPESAKSVNQMITNLAKEEGCTIFLCTHQLRYAQEICTSYGLIDEGHMLANGTLEKLRSLVFSGHKVLIGTNRFALDLPYKKTKEGLYEVAVEREDDIPGLVKAVIDGGGDIYHVSSGKLSLEDIYFSLTDKRKAGGIND